VTGLAGLVEAPGSGDRPQDEGAVA